MRAFISSRRMFSSLMLVSPCLLAICAGGCAAPTKPRAASLTQLPPPSPDPEMRAMFVTTAYNMDWPSKPSLHRSVLRDEIRAICERAHDLKCNTILLQVRGFGDRIQRETQLAANSKPDFKLKDEPWAQSLNWGNDLDTGPSPDFDPLHEWILACDEAGLELHFWVNPFRINSLVKVTINGTEYTLPVIKYEKQLYLNPKSKMVQKYVKAVIQDLIDCYPRPGTYAEGPTAPQLDNVMLASAQPTIPSDVITFNLAGDGGPDGVIFDHHLPDDGSGGGPGTQPTTRSQPLTRTLSGSSSSGGGTLGGVLGQPPKAVALTIKSAAEKRVDWLVSQANAANAANPIPGDSLTETLDTFLDDVWAIVKPKCQFGLSPDADDQKVMQRLADDKVDYVIPELYDSATFQAQLTTWLSKVPNITDPPKVIAGLNTIRVQTPPDPDDDPMPAQTIRDEIDWARNTASGSTKPSGHAHYGASALRLKEHAGPHKDNLGEKLKGTEYQQAQRGPKGRRSGSATAPAAPTVWIEQPTPGSFKAKWTPGSGKKPRRWEVWVQKGTTWSSLGIFGRKTSELDIDASVTKVWVRGFNRYNAEGAWGSSP
jgi:hypothetical protein